MWSGRSAVALGFFGADRAFSGGGCTFSGMGRDSFGATGAFFAARSALSGVDCSTVLVFFGVVGATVEELPDGAGAGADTGSATAQAADASSNVPAIAKLVRRGDPRTEIPPRPNYSVRLPLKARIRLKRKTGPERDSLRHMDAVEPLQRGG